MLYGFLLVLCTGPTPISSTTTRSDNSILPTQSDNMESSTPPNQNEGATPFSLTFCRDAIPTSPYDRRDAAIRSAYLARRHRSNRLLEREAHAISLHNSLFLFVWDTYSAFTVFAGMMFNWSSMLGCALTMGATLLAYYNAPNDRNEWNGRVGITDILLSFAIITPLGQSISMGWSRREAALKSLAAYRSAANSVYIANASWDWGRCHEGKGRRGCIENREDEANVYGDAPSTATDENAIDWLNHSDSTLCHLIHLSDSLCQYLTLPTATRVRHRSTARGRKVSRRVLSTGREIFTLAVCGRMIMISQLCEALKYRGLPGNEAGRLHGWEKDMVNAMEDLRNAKEYRTLQALRVYERLFCLIVPPFYATSYAQVAYDTDSLFFGIAMGVITSFALTGLFECVRSLEDPFVSNLNMDAIDVREELVVLAHQELLVARKMLFPKADCFVLARDLFGDDDAVGDDRRHSVQIREDRKSRHHSSSLFESPGCYSTFDGVVPGGIVPPPAGGFVPGGIVHPPAGNYATNVMSAVEHLSGPTGLAGSWQSDSFILQRQASFCIVTAKH
ncbi:hypothetical protein ACHAW5_003111 [Stephanodiscus triporus]|uniref:Uncharacterized protein n=1 Tax=Stephanodiscus triporus TaxID=2934178 RepID=A0ABD3MF82_9STRA